MGDSHVGLQARLMSQALRKLTGGLSKSNTVAIFINQLREKIGISYGNPEVTPGGRALKFYASVRLDIRRIESIKDGNRGGRQPHSREGRQETSAPRPFARPSSTSCTARASAARVRCSTSRWSWGFVKKAGAWFTYEGEQMGQGRENVKTFLRENPQTMAEIDERVRAHLAKRVGARTSWYTQRTRHRRALKPRLTHLSGRQRR